MELALFGGLSVRIAGGEVNLSSGGARLLTLLALSAGTAVPYDILVFHLWPAQLPKNPKGSLQELVLRLRRAIGDQNRSYIRNTGKGYRLDVGPAALDVEAFRHLAQGGIVLATAEPELAVAYLTESLEIGDGELPDIAPDTFISQRIDQLELLRARAASVLHRLQDGSAGAQPGDRHSRRLGLVLLLLRDLPSLTAAQLAADISRCAGAVEQLSDGVVRATFGGVAQALRAADQAVKLLTGLGALTGGAVSHLVPARDGSEWEPLLKLAASSPAGCVVAPPAIRRVAEMAGNRVPTSPLPDDLWQIGAPAAGRRSETDPPESPFTGRDHNVAELAGLVLRAPLVTLTGPGGIGKTRLAAVVSTSLGEQFDETSRVDLAEADPYEDPLVFVANRLGSITQPDRPILDTLLDRLAHRSGLLVLDNCELFVDELKIFCDAAAVRCPLLRVLATSRTPLHSRDETVYELGGLEPEDAARLLIALAFPGPRAGRPALDESVATSLCERLDGIPLAIECAAPLAMTMGGLPELEATLAQLPDGAMVPLLDAAQGGKGRHRSIERALLLSHRLLSPAEAQFFERLSCLRSVFTPEDASVGGENRERTQLGDLLSRLSEVSLLRSEGSDRWRMLEPVRQFAATLLLRRGEQEAQFSRHGRYFVDFAVRAAAGLRSPDEAYWFERVGQAYPNLLAALNWAVRHGRADDALLLTSSLHWYWAALGMNIEGASALDRALALAGGDPTNRAAALCALAHLAWWAGDPARSESANARALALVVDRTKQDEVSTVLEAWARTGLAAARLWGGGDFHKLAGHLEVAETLFDRVHDDAGLAIALGTHGATAWHYGYDEMHLEKSLASLAAADRAGHQAFKGQMQRDAGLAMAKLGRIEDGRRLLLEGLNLAKRLGDSGGLPMGYGFLGLLEVYANRQAEAIEAFLHSLNHNRKPAQIWSGILAVAFAAEKALRKPADGVSLCAFVERQMRQTGIGLAPAERRRFADARRALEAELNPGACSAAEQLGRAMTLPEAMEVAIRTLEGVVATPLGTETDRFTPHGGGSDPARWQSC